MTQQLQIDNIRTIDLCSCFDHGTHGKVIRFYSPNSQQWETQTAPDHEAFMRQADALLLAHLAAAYREAANRLVANGKIESINCPEALELLKKCITALEEGREGVHFASFAPFSSELIELAAGYIKISIQTLGYGRAVELTPLGFEKLYHKLNDLCSKAEQKYQVEKYHEAHSHAD